MINYITKAFTNPVIYQVFETKLLGNDIWSKENTDEELDETLKEESNVEINQSNEETTIIIDVIDVDQDEDEDENDYSYGSLFSDDKPTIIKNFEIDSFTVYSEGNPSMQFIDKSIVDYIKCLFMYPQIDSDFKSQLIHQDLVSQILPQRKIGRRKTEFKVVQEEYAAKIYDYVFLYLTNPPGFLRNDLIEIQNNGTLIDIRRSLVNQLYSTDSINLFILEFQQLSGLHPKYNSNSTNNTSKYVGEDLKLDFHINSTCLNY